VAFVLALVAISLCFPVRAFADCVEDPNGGCLSATPRPTVRPSPTVPGTTATPRPAPLTLVSIVCDHGANWGHDIITVRVTYSGPTEAWSSSDAWWSRKEATGTGTYTFTIVADPSFNKLDLKLFRPGVTWPTFADPSQDSLAGLTVHYVACP
jgi:hypothetical protein